MSQGESDLSVFGALVLCIKPISSLPELQIPILHYIRTATREHGFLVKISVFKLAY